MKNQILRLLILSGALMYGMGAGCITFVDPKEEEQAQAHALRQRMAFEQLQGEVLKMRERVAALETVKESQASQLEQLQATLSDTRRVVREMGEFMANLHQSLRRIETAQAKQRTEIVDEISRKIEEVLKDQAAKAVPPPPPPVKTVTGFEHTVKKGETLRKIADAYKVPLTTVLQANGLKESDPLLVGQKLFIPSP